MSQIDWSAKFNALPFEVRTIGSALEAKTRIQMLNFEKDRLKRRSIQSLKEINTYIKNCEKYIQELEAQENDQPKEREAGDREN